MQRECVANGATLSATLFFLNDFAFCTISGRSASRLQRYCNGASQIGGGGT